MKRIAFALALMAGLTASAKAGGQAVPQQTPLQRLQASIERTTRSISAAWGVYVKSLETGEEIALDADRQMETMSTIKIPLMVEAFEQIKAGTFKLTDKYTFAQADSQPGTGTIQRLDPGAVMTVKDLSDRVKRSKTRSASSRKTSRTILRTGRNLQSAINPQSAILNPQSLVP